MKLELSKDEISSVKQSFFNIIALFLSKEQVSSKYVACLMKWSVQLNLSQQDLHRIEGEFDRLEFNDLESKVERLEAIYHIVHMIYMDNIVEDIELEVASMYAEKLGFKPDIVGELFKAIATAPFDGGNPDDFKQNIKEFLEVNDID